jgi:hypothetical protein
MNTDVLYTVTVIFTDSAVADEWEDWMRGGHMQALLQRGAQRAELVRWTDLPSEGGAIHLTAHYRFPNAETLDTYLRDHAPALREDGLSKFPTNRGVTYSRRIGAVLLPRDHT